MKKKISVVALLYILGSMCAYAQMSARGVVVDKVSGEPMPYVTVAVLGQDSSLIAGTCTDENGAYSMSVPEGNYQLEVSFVGYKTQYSTSLNGEFALEEETAELQEVVVKAKRPLIERQMEKVVFNVSQSPMAAGSSGKELLKKAPGVFVDKDGNVTYNGKGVEVYIDGRPSYLSGEQLRTMLESTSGSTIDKIELISNPGAKYDASGTGGIINIKLKRNKSQGLNGMINASYGGMYFKDLDRYEQRENVAANLNYRAPHSYTYVQLTQAYQTMGVTLDAKTQTPLMKRDALSVYDLDFQYYMAKVGTDWYIDSVNTFGFFVQAPFMLMSQYAPADKGGSMTQIFDTDGQVVQSQWVQSETGKRERAPQLTANLNFTHVFDESLERELTANIDYNRHHSRSVNVQHNDLTDSHIPDLHTWDGLDINSSQLANIYSAKLDFQTHFWKTGMLETGGKYTLSTMNSRMMTDSLAGEDWQVVSSTPSDFDYHEHVAALYIAAGKQFGQHWNAKVGLRGEYTYSVGNWITADSISRKSYFNLFPSVHFGYTSAPLGKIGQPIMVSAGYTRRVKRPNYYILNPFRTYVDAHNYTMGNTELVPEFNNDVEVNFAYSQYLSLTFNFSHTQNMFSAQTTVMDNGDGCMRWLNFGTCTTHGGNLSLTELPLVPKFDSNHRVNGAWLALTVNVGYYNFLNRSYAKNADGTPQYCNQNDFFRFNGTLNAYLPKDWNLSVDAWYGSPMTIGYNYQHATYSLSCGIQKAWYQKGVILNISAEDLLRSSVDFTESLGLPEGQFASTRQDYHNQKVCVSVTYLFGRQQQTKHRNVGDTEFTSRLGK